MESKAAARLYGFFMSLFLVFLLYASSPHANAGINCGIKPIIPIGCSDAICLCDDDGNCQWVYVCD